MIPKIKKIDQSRIFTIFVILTGLITRYIIQIKMYVS